MIERENTSRASTAGDNTRDALIRAGLRLFGTQGYSATSTRQLATAAKANIGSISYHFGGKEGLRTAIADYIVITIKSLALQTIGNVNEAPPAPLSQFQSRQLLHLALKRMLDFVAADPTAGEIVQFVLRELAEPSPTIDQIYSGVFEPLHKRLCLLWEFATGEDSESENTRILVFSFIGQVLYFRIGREPITRRMNWTTIGKEQTATISRSLERTLNDMFATRPITDGSDLKGQMT